MKDKSGYQYPIDVQTKIKKYISKHPELFTVMSVAGGNCGNLLFRIIAGTDDIWLWKKYMSMSKESDSNSSPLSWPRNTEGYLTYEMYGWEKNKGSRTWSSYFKENHLASAHTGMTNIEYTPQTRFNTYVSEAINSNKKILMRSHNLDIHLELDNVDIIRVHGNLKDILVPLIKRKHKYYLRNNVPTKPINYNKVYNLDISKLINRDYNIFVDEYLQLCDYFNMYPNISNVRAYILLWIERLDRVSNDM